MAQDANFQKLKILLLILVRMINMNSDCFIEITDQQLKKLTNKN
jgi:hypothetical protein